MNTNEQTKCKCGATFQPSGCGTGYATLPDDTRVCYACADKLQVEQLKDRSKPVVAYVGKDGFITTWTGGKLMTITRAWPCQLVRQSFLHDKKGYMSIHAVDAHGGHWTGRGSEGIAIKLRPVKG